MRELCFVSPVQQKEDESQIHKYRKGSRYVWWGYEVNTSSDDCIAAINSYSHQVHLSLLLQSYILLPFLFCVSPILAFFDIVVRLMKVLGYGREKKVILEAPLYDKDYVLGNVLAAHYLISSDLSRAKTYVKAAESYLVSSTLFFYSSVYVFILSEGKMLCVYHLSKIHWFYSQGKATPYEKAVFKAVNYLISDNMDEDVALELHFKVRMFLGFWFFIVLLDLLAVILTLM